MNEPIKRDIREQIRDVQNEEICRLLLGWKLVRPATAENPAAWREQRDGYVVGHRTPRFETMDESALILERLVQAGYLVNMWCSDGRCSVEAIDNSGTCAMRLQHDPLPEVIRRVALIAIGPMMHRE